MLLYVGESALRGSIERYWKRHNLIELRAEVGRLPRPARLKAWRSSAPEGFRFSVALSPAAALPRGESALDYGLKAAEALGAAWIVLGTGRDLAPSVVGRARLAELATRLRGLPHRIAWAPHGVWELGVAEEEAERLGLTLVRDLARDEAGDGSVAYTRLRTVGSGGTVRLIDAERTAARLMGVEEGYVIVEGRGAALAQRVIREELALVGEDGVEGQGDDAAEEADGEDEFGLDADDAESVEEGEDGADEDDS